MPAARPLAEHLARHRLADLFLDTLPYNAHTTASDALWTGLPVVTCQGNTFAGRVGASLLNAVGLPELVTHSPSTKRSRFGSRAIRRCCAVSAPRWRNRLDQPLFDTDRFRRGIEAAYQRMWQTWQRGEAAQAFRVDEFGAAAVTAAALFRAGAVATIVELFAAERRHQGVTVMLEVARWSLDEVFKVEPPRPRRPDR